MRRTDEKLIELMQNGSEKIALGALGEIFKDGHLFNKAVRWITKNGGKTVDGEDIAQDAVLAFYENVRKGKYTGEGNIEGYYLGIVKGKFANFRRKKVNQHLIYEPEKDLREGDNPIDAVFYNDLKIFLERKMTNISEKCQQLLIYWMLGYDPKEISIIMDYENSDRAKKETYKCRNNLRSFFGKEDRHIVL